MNTMPILNQEYGKLIQLPFVKQTNTVTPLPLPVSHPNLNDTLDDFDLEINTRHDAEPFKSKEDVNRILTYFLEKHMKSWNTSQKHPSRKWNPRYLRNYMLFQIGCNVGIRCSDLRQLQMGHFIDQYGSYKETTEILEKKTMNTRKVLKSRIIDINDGIKSALELYKQFHINWSRKDYLFPNSYDSDNRPSKDVITRQNVDLIIKNTTKELTISGRYASHSFRKYFGREFILQNGNDERAVLMLQILYGHSSPEITKQYIGITRDEIRNATLNLGIGLTSEESLKIRVN